MTSSSQFCPRCYMQMNVVGERRGGFSGGKAVVGAIVAGPIGIVAGALGKKKITYQCPKCGYVIEK